MTELLAVEAQVAKTGIAPVNSRNRKWRLGLTAGGTVAILVFVAVGAPLLAPDSPYTQNLHEIGLPPSWSSGHLLGTDALGRDVLSRVLYGGRPPVLIGVGSVLVALILGVGLGLIAGYRGGWWDSFLGRLADMQLSIPGIILAIFILAFLGTGLRNVVIVIALESWPVHYRVTRTVTISTRNRAYVEAARIAGLGRLAVLRRHILPSVLPSLAVTSTANFVTAVLTEASLSFLGLGIQPPTPDWGYMISDGRTLIVSAWWISIFPGIALFILLFSAQVLGDRLARAFSLQDVRS